MSGLGSGFSIENFNQEITMDLRPFQMPQLVLALITVVFCGSVASAQLKSWKKLGDLSNLVVFHAVAADLMNGISHLLGLWILGKPVAIMSSNEVLCQITSLMTLSAIGWSSWSTFFIAYERFESVTRPFSRKLTLRRSFAIAVAMWMGNIVVASVGFTGVIEKPGLFRLPDNKTAICLFFRDSDWATREKVYTVGYYTAIAFIPLSLTAYFFVRVLLGAWRVLGASDTEVNSGNVLGIQAAQRRHVKRLLRSKGFRCIMAIIASHILLAFPFHTVNVIYVINRSLGSKTMRPFLFMYSALFVVNSILYVYWLETLRSQLAWLLCCRSLSRKLPDWVTSSFRTVQRQNKATSS
jgi:hypothetical protein